jgi:hypothetical protein
MGELLVTLYLLTHQVFERLRAIEPFPRLGAWSAGRLWVRMWTEGGGEGIVPSRSQWNTRTSP